MLVFKRGVWQNIAFAVQKFSTVLAPASTSSLRKINVYENISVVRENVLKWNNENKDRIPLFRIKQIEQWIYEFGCTDFNSMNNIPKSLREFLSESFQFGDFETKIEQVSKIDGTIKRVYALKDGQLIESVLMSYRDGRRTACISSQAGCGMGCVFCATGQMGFSRQLTATEIYEQVAKFHYQLQWNTKHNKYGSNSNSMEAVTDPTGRLSNIVFMGMGEPFANYNNVIAAIRLIRQNLNIGLRHITVSTVGIPPRIRKLAEEIDLPVNLAISLHHATDTKRSKLMPVNLRYPIHELMNACVYYTNKTNRRISFEWALIQGETDTIDCAYELGDLMLNSGINLKLVHINLIPLNSTELFDGNASTETNAKGFISILEQYGIGATMRVRRGIDINAGCGQLKSEVLRNCKGK